MATPQPTQAPQRSRGFSVKSDNSRRSSGHKSQLSESSEEKARRNLHTKADPLVAMTELQPSMFLSSHGARFDLRDRTRAILMLYIVAVALEKSNLASLRETQHKDQFGNPISSSHYQRKKESLVGEIQPCFWHVNCSCLLTLAFFIADPDWSNPTRPRFERPLDTIRSFEAAINGTYGTSRRDSYARTGSLFSTPTQGPQTDYDYSPTDDAGSQMGDFSRRTSYHGEFHANRTSILVADRDETGPNTQTNRGNDQSQYGRNGQSSSSVIDYASSSQAPENPYPYNQSGQQRRPRYQSRQSTDQGVYGNGNQYGAPQYQYQKYRRSYDNVTAMSGSASGNTDSYGQSTDPSSLNSSMDQLQQQRQDGTQAEYGFQGQNINGRGMPSAPAPAASSTFEPSLGGRNVVKKPTNMNDKRKSWFKRRFSKD
ncbi:hypothetical protein N7486_000370 [Penicillium sp. IBT 16267x]|nr:hypothetical protein N7486_000370 [Penicillium sp. IBT 16267x]